ncbi:hypothetical protein ABPG72_013418 [Tetrahymena utriculariae]
MWIVDLVSQPLNWRIYQGLFKGQCLEEEMAFANYYHLENTNRVLHLFCYIATFSLLSAQIGDYLGIIGSCLWYAFFFLVYSKISIAITIFYLGTAHLIKPLLSNVFPIYFFPLAVLMFQVFQFLGHYYIEKKFPAFRVFEATVITPITIALTLLNEIVPFQRELVKEILKYTELWKSKLEAQQ